MRLLRRCGRRGESERERRWSVHREKRRGQAKGRRRERGMKEGGS